MDNQITRELCIFCCKTVSSVTNNFKKLDKLARDNKEQEEDGRDRELLQNQRILDRFFTMVERRFSHDHDCRESVLRKNKESRYVSGNVHVCFDCFPVIESYCTLYHQLKSLELRMNYQLDKLRNVMRFADRVPTRVKAFREWSASFQDEDQVDFRKVFKRKCKLNQSMESPRVCIASEPRMMIPEIEVETSTTDMITETEVVDEGTDAAVSNMGTVSQNREIHIENVESSSTLFTTDKERIKHYSLGWIASFSSLIFLHQIHIKNVPEIPESPITPGLPATAEVTATMSKEVVHGEAEEETFEGVDVTSMISEESSHSETSVDGGNGNMFHVAETDSSRVEEENKQEPIRSVVDDKSMLGDLLTTCAVNTSQHETFVENIQKSVPFVASDDAIFSSTFRTSSTPPPEVIPPVLVRRSLRQVLKCTTCKATFTSSTRLETHLASMHGSSKMEISESESDVEEADRTNDAENSMDVDDDWCGVQSTSSGRVEMNFRTLDIKTGTGSENGDTDYESLSAEEPKVEKEPQQSTRSPEPYKCSQCSPKIGFNSLRKLQFHTQYLHSNGNTRIDFRHVHNGSTSKMDLQDLQLENYPVSVHSCSEDKCSKSYPLPSELLHHKKLCHNSSGQSLNCSICELSQPNLIDLIWHELEHTNSQQQESNKNFQPGSKYFCGRCTVFKIKKICFINHYLEAHLEETPIQAKCPICSEIFQNKEQVPITHYINFHDLRRLGDPKNPFRCSANECPAYFLSEDQLHIHRNQFHKEHLSIARFEADMKRVKRAEISNKRTRLYNQKIVSNMLACSQCPQLFRYSADLRTHVWRAHNKNNKKAMKKQRLSKRLISTPAQGLTVDDLVYNRKAKYFCSVKQCKKGFMEEAAFESHSKLHGEFKCNSCDIVKTFAPDLAIHETLHTTKGTDSGRVCCGRCSFATSRLYEFTEHHLENHLGLTQDKICCPICKLEYKRQSGNHDSTKRGLKFAVIRHYVMFHDLSDGESSLKAYKCERENCIAYFRTALQLQKHVINIHEKISKMELYKCEDCGKCHPNAHSLRDHRLGRHKKSAEDFRFVCKVPECGERYERQLELEQHVHYCHTRNKNRQIDCPEVNCEKKFWGLSGLKRHLQGKDHRKEVQQKKVHVCVECGKSLPVTQIALHKLYHEKPESWKFSCSICNKKVATNCKLKEHMRTHTKEKPYVCQMCGVKYAHRHNLNHHMKSKHGMDVRTKTVEDTSNFASTRKGKKLKTPSNDVAVEEEEDDT